MSPLANDPANTYNVGRFGAVRLYAGADRVWPPAGMPFLGYSEDFTTGVPDYWRGYWLGGIGDPSGVNESWDAAGYFVVQHGPSDGSLGTIEAESYLQFPDLAPTPELVLEARVRVAATTPGAGGNVNLSVSGSYWSGNINYLPSQNVPPDGVTWYVVRSQPFTIPDTQYGSGASKAGAATVSAYMDRSRDSGINMAVDYMHCLDNATGLPYQVVTK